jgi:hypothetical protein
MNTLQEITKYIQEHKNSEKIFLLVKQLQHMLVENPEEGSLAIAYMEAWMSEPE